MMIYRANAELKQHQDTIKKLNIDLTWVRYETDKTDSEVRGLLAIYH